IVGRGAVAAQNDEVVEILVGEHHAPLHAILDHRVALARPLEADHWRDAGGGFHFISVAPGPVMSGPPPCRTRNLAHGNKLLGARMAAIGLALAKQLLGSLAVTRSTRELIDRLTVPIELEPAQTVENRQDYAFRRARPVGVLDAQQHFAALGFGIEPIEQGRARAADMQIAGGRGRKTRDDVGSHFAMHNLRGNGGRTGGGAGVAWGRGRVRAEASAMPGREMRVLGDSGEDSPHRSHSASSVVTALSRSLEAESDRLSLWVPVLLAGGILI